MSNVYSFRLIVISLLISRVAIWRIKKSLTPHLPNPHLVLISIPISLRNLCNGFLTQSYYNTNKPTFFSCYPPLLKTAKPAYNFVSTLLENPWQILDLFRVLICIVRNPHTSVCTSIHWDIIIILKSHNKTSGIIARWSQLFSHSG